MSDSVLLMLAVSSTQYFSTEGDTLGLTPSLSKLDDKSGAGIF